MLKLSFISIISVFLLSCEHQKFGSLNEQLLTSEGYSQKINEVLFDIGSGYISDISSDISSTKKSDENRAKISKISYVFDRMQDIDDESHSFIRFIDSLKISLLKNAKEDYKYSKNDSKILRDDFTDTNIRYPLRFDLTKLKNKDIGEVASDLFIDKNKANKNGEKLWGKLINYRKKIVEAVASYQWGTKQFTINMTEINDFKNKKDLQKQVGILMDRSNANLKEDRQVLIDLYILLTKNKANRDGEHWIYQCFENTTVPGAFNRLTALQYDILSARRLALAHWRSKVVSCGYSFTSILPLTKGPNTAIAGQDFDLTVFMGAFDEDNQPRVTIDNLDSEITYPQDGTGNVKLNLKEGLHHLKGTVSIKNKSGVEKTENWEWTINVIEKEN